MGEIRTSVALAAALLGASCGPAVAQDLPPAVVEDLRVVVEGALDSIPVPGLAVAVVRDGELAFVQGYGVTDLESRTPVLPGTLFQIGSISKAFTATLAAMMVQEGVIGWDDPVDRILPHAAVPAPAPTVGELASHTSGLPGDAPTLRRKHGDYPVLAFTHFELYQSLARSTLQFPPGEAWGYSNFGYAVLGHALETAADIPWEVLLAEKVLTPLGLSSTTATLWPEVRDRLATPHWLVDGELVEYLAPWDEEALAPAGGLSSTAEDLARFLVWHMERANEGGEVAGLHQPRVEASGRWYGRGWFVETVPGVGRVVSVGGDVDGFVGELVFAPDRGLGTVILVNSGDAPFLPQLGRWIIASVASGEAGEASALGLEIAYRRGMLHQGLGEWRDAMRELEEATAAGDSLTRRNALYQIGRTGALSGLYDRQAVEALEAYLAEPLAAIPPAAALWRLGQVHEHAGRCDAAGDAYRRALAEDVDYGPARDALERLQARAGACGFGVGGG